jgi:hypothetical protein
MYQFDICNNFIYFENFDYLNVSKVDANMGYWQVIWFWIEPPQHPFHFPDLFLIIQP